MYYENCGNNLGDNEAFFCEQCGRAIRQENHLIQQDVIYDINFVKIFHRFAIGLAFV